MSLNNLWEASSAPYYPLVSKESQFTVGFALLFISKKKNLVGMKTMIFTDADHFLALLLTGLFGLSEPSSPACVLLSNLH